MIDAIRDGYFITSLIEYRGTLSSTNTGITGIAGMPLHQMLYPMCGSLPSRTSTPTYCNDSYKRITTVAIAQPMARLIDEMLLAWVLALVWTVHSIEQIHTGQSVESFKYNYRKLLNQITPTAIVEPHTEGLLLRLTVYNRLKLPSWSALDRRQEDHPLNVMQKFTWLDDLSEQEIERQSRVILNMQKSWRNIV